MSKETFEKEYETQMKKKIEYENKFNVENWYKLIEKETFKTKTTTFSIREAKVFMKYYKNTLNKEKETLSKEEEEVILEVEKGLDKIILENFPEGCFVRYEY
jgi:hypothetical protein